MNIYFFFGIISAALVRYVDVVERGLKQWCQNVKTVRGNQETLVK